LPARVACPRCKTRFVVNEPAMKDRSNLIKEDRDAVHRASAGNGEPAAATLAAVAARVPRVQQGGNYGRGLGLLIAAAVVFLLLGGIALVLMLSRGTAKTSTEPSTEAVVEDAPLNARDRKIHDAVTHGVQYLRNQILNPGDQSYYFADPGAGSNVGVLALAGLTLLECGVASSDPAVEKVIQTVQAEAPRLTFTYSVALSILFLDRLNQCKDRSPDPNQRELIQRLAVQMMAAQNASGGWGYTCPLLAPWQHEKYLSELRTNEFRPGSFDGPYDDNSINQFATLALWAARKHDIQTEPALAMVERRYQENQNADGSWGYRARDNGYLKDATTCAGLIGLAVGQGIRLEGDGASTAARPAADPTRDPHIARGLAFVAKAIGKNPARMNPRDRDSRHKHTADMMALNREWQEGPESARPLVMRRMKELDKAPLLKGTYFNADAWGDLYFLWSVERVAVVFDLKVIGGKEWYDWGTDIILANQLRDGSWRDRFPGVPDTCFALLFLKRVNIAKDLTDKFRLAAGSIGIGSAPVPSGQIPPPPPPRKQ
jgi:hypothetical protein